MNDISNFGSFYWNEMLEWSLNLGDQGREPFEAWIYNLVKRFPCEKCKSHFEYYLKLHPLAKYPDLSKWVWAFHNSVNKKLDKPIISYETAISNPPKSRNHQMYWHEMFLYALSVQSLRERELFRQWIHNLALRYGSNLFNVYLHVRPIERAIEPVIWVFNFHNVLNQLLDKPVLRYKAVLEQIVIQMRQCENCKVR